MDITVDLKSNINFWDKNIYEVLFPVGWGMKEAENIVAHTPGAC